MVDIARGLAERGLPVELLLIRAEGPFVEHVPSNVGVVDLGARRALTCLMPLIRYLRRRRPSVMLATLPEASIVAMLACTFGPTRVPVIVRRASNLSMEYGSGNAKMRLTLRIERLFLPTVRAVVVNSPGVAEDLKKHVPAISHLVSVISNPVVWADHQRLAALPVDGEWFNDPRTPVVLSVGRLAPPKDLVTLLHAFADIAKSRPARLVVLGEGPQRGDLTRLASRLGVRRIVDFAGFVLNPFAFMSKAHVVVLSSRYEGSPNVLIQAMACGTSVVSTDCPSGPREILEDGKWGALVPVGDVEAMAAAIVEVLEHPTDPGTLVARASEYNAESSIDAYLRLIHGASEGS
ncbi:MAG: glycosyltransferase [Gammaproteobacteria bacterium]|nr:glycosyltransferase [Gammaproteobacteria bacterium]